MYQIYQNKLADEKIIAYYYERNDVFWDKYR